MARKTDVLDYFGGAADADVDTNYDLPPQPRPLTNSTAAVAVAYQVPRLLAEPSLDYDVPRQHVGLNKSRKPSVDSGFVLTYLLLEILRGSQLEKRIFVHPRENRKKRKSYFKKHPKKFEKISK